MIEMRVLGVIRDRRRDYPALVLCDEIGSYLVLIWVGSSEARALQVCLGRIRSHRPLTHALTLRVWESTGVKLQRVLISDCRERVYRAHLVLQGPRPGLTTVDARPSDAVALALLSRCEIVVGERVPRVHVAGLAEMTPAERNQAAMRVLRRADPRGVVSGDPRERREGE
jgi:bifunctional DNase/RNase